MDKESFKIALLIGVLCLVIGVLIGLGVAMIPEGKCIRSPLNYGISQLEQGDLKVTCYCSFNDFNYAPFFFNKTGVFLYGNQN